MDAGTVTALGTALGPSATIAIIWLIGKKQKQRSTGDEPASREQLARYRRHVDRVDEEAKQRDAALARTQMELEILLDRDGANGIVSEHQKLRRRVHWLHDAISVMCVQLKVDPPERDWPE